MKTLALFLFLMTLSGALAAQTDRLCQQVLVPTEEQATSDYRRMQAFMSINSSYEYDRLTSLSEESRALEGSYKMFSAEYNDSRTKEEFSERIRQRLSRENFTLSESDARSYAKVGLTDFQVAAWLKCVERVTGAGGLLLSARNNTDNGFSLLVERIFPRNVGSGSVNITLVGGKISNRRFLQESYKKDGSKAYEVTRDKSAPAVRISGTLMSMFADSVLVDYSPPLPPPVVKYEKRFPASTISLGGYVFYDPAQGMIASANPNGGPSENFSIEVETPRAGTYAVEAMWTAATNTEVYVYAKPLAKSCTDPGLNMNDADIHFLPSVTGAWIRSSLPPYPDRIGNLLLPAGKTRIVFTSRSCGGGLGGGRLPSTAWIQLREL